MSAIDERDAWSNDREEARTETARTNTPRRGSLEEAIERGYDPRDHIEDQP